jgi:penicillin G amidase
MLFRSVMLACLVLSAAHAQTPLQNKANSALAMIQGELRTAGLHQTVRVQRDRWGVAHIYAKDQHDLFFAQGFVVSQDRLFQMELWKRSGQGRLAEILGESFVQRDVNARRLRYRGDMAAEYSSYAPDAREILTAFTEGINAYIAYLKSAASPGLPIEFQIAGFSPEAWKPEDCLNRLAAYAMMGNASSELLYAQTLSLVGVDRASSLFEFDPAVKLDPATGVDFAGLKPALLEDIVSSDRRIPFAASDLRESNNWAVSGSLTKTGKPLLANDPHRVIANPSLRYIVHLVAPGWNVIGAGEPGLPGVAAGHNEFIAWGFTIFGLDQQDLYQESVKADGSNLYQTAKGWQPLREERETISVRGAPAVQVTLQFSPHGPIMWRDGTRALSLRWVGAEPGAAGYLGSLALDRARNWHEFEEAMPRWKVPSENIVYADREGNIGEHSTGLAPIRKNFTGLLPLPSNGHYEWSGWVPNAELPHSFNPPDGFVATANHRMIPSGYGYRVGYEWGSPIRFQRIHDVLQIARQTSHKLTVEDMEQLQADVLATSAKRLQPLLRDALKNSPSETLTESANLILNWDAELTVDSAAATLYEFWGHELREAVTHAAVPEAARAAVPTLSLYQSIGLLTEASADVFGAETVKARDSLLIQTLTAARDKLISKRGNDVHNWAWGILHTAQFHHALDSLPAAAALLDPPGVARSGDGDSVQSTAYDGASLEQIAGASYREVFDLSDWDNAAAINVPGQSAQPGSKHFADLLPLWSTSRYFPLKYSKPAVDDVTTDTLTLTP